MTTYKFNTMIKETDNNTDPKGTNPNGADNNPSEAIDSPKEVEEANDPNIDEDFPGYPHYPAKEDILEPENNNGRVDVDVENLTTQGRNIKEEMRNELFTPADGSVNVPFEEMVENDEDNDDIEIVPGTDADVTSEDLVLLGERDQDMDLGEDEEVRSTRSLLDKAGYELDTPGTEIDDPNESIGEEDEENNYYSLGGDRHENLEEDRNTF
jgi:hypothetical protein